MAVRKYNIEDQKGKKYNRITILGEIVHVGKEREWTYVCECGGTGKTKPSHIVRGIVKSCGCLHVEQSKENLKLALLSPLIGKNSTHGMSDTRQYSIWTGMKTRCNNENVVEYPDYGGRGINYCPKWETFEGFWEDMEEGYSDLLTIERVDTNGNYEKSNCVWDTMKRQSHNRRKMKGERSSIFVGVSKRKDALTYRAGIVNPEKRKLSAENFKTELDAAIWYDDLAEEFYGHRPNKTESKND